MSRSKRARKKTTRPDPKWKVFERTVAALERLLAPGAKVEHNVQLPNLFLKGETCQCDVVIWTGIAPRETVTIVEVQRRGRAVDVNVFRGWCEKMKQVGAQHLICVSTKPFPRSIIQDAAMRGPTVRLVRLRELEHDQWPVGLAFGLVETALVNVGRFAELQITPVGAWQSQPADGVQSGERVFECAGHLHSLDEIAKHSAMQARVVRGPNTQLFSFRTGEPCFFVSSGGRTPVTIEATVHVAIERAYVPLSLMSYEQVDRAGALAWMLNARGQFDGEPCDLRVAFTPESDGRLKPAKVDVAGGRPGDGFSVELRNFRFSLSPLRRG